MCDGVTVEISQDPGGDQPRLEYYRWNDDGPRPESIDWAGVHGGEDNTCWVYYLTRCGIYRVVSAKGVQYLHVYRRANGSLDAKEISAEEITEI